MPKVSVIMGIYNVEDTLVEALESLLNQTFQNFEIIMCDDGSTDNTFSTAIDYVKKYPEKIKLIKNEKNMGLNYTLNQCLELVTGEYTARMDGDDISISNRFEVQVEFLDNHPEYGFVSSSMIYFDEKGDFRQSKESGARSKYDLAKSNMFCHAPVMIRTEAYRKVNGYTVNKWMLRVEDVNLWFKLYAAGYIGYNISTPLYKMRDNRDAINRRKFKYRVNSTYTRLVGFRSLNIPLRYYPYAFIPVIIGLIPKPIYVILHRSKDKKVSI